jgi:putative glycosyltransferase (TIGR04348 family)
MRIGIITPAPPRSRYGNRVTAVRWARILKALGHKARIAQAYEGEPYDLMVALHARRSYPSIRRFGREHPERPLVVALTGTDLYHDLPRSRTAQKSVELATCLVVLQPKALDELGTHLHEKVRVIYQSTSARPWKRFATGVSGARGSFDVCVVGHLRPVKDPFRAAFAARRLPPASRIRILQVGAAMSGAMASRARAEMKVNPRYHWLGEQPRWRVQQILARAKLLVLSSKLEGGANVLSEAIAAGVPVLASLIPGSVGILGEDYAGYFRVGDAVKLRELLTRAETDREFRDKLRSHGRNLAPLFHPARERSAWQRLLKELACY